MYCKDKTDNKVYGSRNYISDFGMTDTYKLTSVMVYFAGMSFGVPYSMTHINAVDWIHTKWHLKLIRVIIGTSIASAAYYTFELYLP